MNSVNARSSNRANHANNNRPSQSVETAGSLAMMGNRSWLSGNIYDSFISSNPFSVDYSQYSNVSNSDGSVAYAGFFGSVSNAMSTMGGSGSSSGFSDCSGGGFSGASSGASSGGSSGGFTSVC